MKIRLAQPLTSLVPSYHNGPGQRVSIWTQGCSLLCTKNCLNPHYLDPNGGFQFEIEQVIDRLLQVQCETGPQNLEGITILGGEPSDQIEAVAELCARTKKLGLTIMLYSGYYKEALEKKYQEKARSLFEVADLLVDGPYKEQLYDDTLPWRGSSNQNIHILSQAYTAASLEAAFAKQGKGYSFSIKNGQLVNMSGLQNREAAQKAETTWFPIS